MSKEQIAFNVYLSGVALRPTPEGEIFSAYVDGRLRRVDPQYLNRFPPPLADLLRWALPLVRRKKKEASNAAQDHHHVP